LVFFAEFLATTGVFEHWVSQSPLEYRSGNAPGKRDVLGTLMHSVRKALNKPWALDIDASIKPLYRCQEGDELGYNRTKPKRPSHVLHTFWVCNLRLVLDVQVSSGKQHTSVHAKAALDRLLDELGGKRPAVVRGDSGYGNEGILLELELEGRGQPYVLRLRQTANVQRLVARQFERQDWNELGAAKEGLGAGRAGIFRAGAARRFNGWAPNRAWVVTLPKSPPMKAGCPWPL
jgi:hypothetical protein